jgi:hypothetical protein
MGLALGFWSCYYFEYAGAGFLCSVMNRSKLIISRIIEHEEIFDVVFQLSAAKAYQLNPLSTI